MYYDNPSFCDLRPKSLTASFRSVSGNVFQNNIINVCDQNDRFRQHISIKANYGEFECWMAEDKSFGFAVGKDLELTNVFSLVRGGGTRALSFATRHYPELHLNCFEGWLEGFYARHGFEVERRETNIDRLDPDDLSNPDVVFMRWRHAPQKTLAIP